LLLILSFPLLSLAQQEDVDTDTATLILNIERALSIQVFGGPLTVTIDATDLEKSFIPLENLQVLVNSLVSYQVEAYGVVSPGGIEISMVQLRVEEIIGPFDAILAPDFAPLGSPDTPLPLFTGGNNIGVGTVATIGLQLDLSKISDPLLERYAFTISFTVVER